MTYQELKQKARELGEQPAFPCECIVKFTSGRKANERPFDSGLTKREYFAGLAMQGVVQQVGDISIKSISKVALQQADALLMELVKEQQ